MDSPEIRKAFEENGGEEKIQATDFEFIEVKEENFSNGNFVKSGSSPLDGDIYPGQKPVNEDRVIDHNSNGIFGVDEHGIAYERLYCDNYPPVGVAILGDSASAHFSLPPSWFRPTEFNENTFKNLFMLLTNELDWPQLSWATGHSENCWMDDIKSYSDIQMDSIYKRLVERNRCGLNDYQNQE